MIISGSEIAGEGVDDRVGEVGSPSTGISGTDPFGCEEGARSVVKRPVLSSKAILASSSIMADKTTTGVLV
jgi:hypothetical protein